MALMFFVIFYARIDGIDYTEGQLLVHYWKEFLFSICCGGISVWLMTKYKS